MKTWFLFTVLMWGSHTAPSVARLFHKIVGETVVLEPWNVEGPISSVRWSTGSVPVAEWDGNGTSSYGAYQGRVTVNNKTGQLTMTQLTLNDSGKYTMEVDDRFPKEIELLVIAKRVPTPNISVKCDAGMNYCILTCEGDVSGAEPVTYHWHLYDMVMRGKKHFNLTREYMEDISCGLDNEASYSYSETIANPLRAGSLNVVIILFAFCCVGVVLCVIVGILLCIKKGRKCCRHQSSSPPL